MMHTVGGAVLIYSICHWLTTRKELCHRGVVIITVIIIICIIIISLFLTIMNHSIFFTNKNKQLFEIVKYFLKQIRSSFIQPKKKNKATYTFIE